MLTLGGKKYDAKPESTAAVQMAAEKSGRKLTTSGQEHKEFAGED